MSAEETYDSNAEIEHMLADISGIELEEGGNLQNDVVRLQNENAELRNELNMKTKLLELQKGTYDAQENQLKMHRGRMATQDQKIKQLETELKTYKAGGSSVSSKSGSSIDFEKKNSEIQRYLEEQRNKSKDLSIKIDQLNSEIQALKNHNNSQTESSGNDSRQMDTLRELYEQKRSELQKSESERQRLIKEVQELTLKCQLLQNERKEEPIKEATKQTNNTEVNALNKKIKQLQKKIATTIDQKQKEKKTVQKFVEKLKGQLNEANKIKDNIKFKLCELQSQNQKLRNSVPGQSDLSELPSSISHESTIVMPKKKQMANIDDQIWNEPLPIQPQPVNKKIVESLIQHFNRIDHQQKLPFLNTIATWSQEQQERLETSSYDLMGQMNFD